MVRRTRKEGERRSNADQNANHAPFPSIKSTGFCILPAWRLPTLQKIHLRNGDLLRYHVRL